MAAWDKCHIEKNLLDQILERSALFGPIKVIAKSVGLPLAKVRFVVQRRRLPVEDRTGLWTSGPRRIQLFSRP